MTKPLHTAVQNYLEALGPKIPSSKEEAEALEELRASFEVDQITHETVKSGKDLEEYHESFGMAALSRCSGGPNKFFGSHLECHPNYITLTVSRGVRDYDTELYYDRYRSSHRGRSIVELNFTAAQFAGLLTTMNMGDGVPCTLTRIGGRRLADVPDNHKAEHRKVRSGFKKEMDNILETVSPHVEKIEKVLQKKSIGVKDRKTIREELTFIQRVFSDSAPFALSQFEESAEKVVTASKAEIEASMVGMVQRLGERALAEELKENGVQAAAADVLGGFEVTPLPPEKE